MFAPHARTVEWVAAGRRGALARQADGFWTGRLPELAELDYALSLDGGPPLPDPRSRWQPHGVLGASRVLASRDYAWRARDFRAQPLAQAVLYELHVGTFTPGGTFRSAIERLDALVELGVTHVELMPVAAFAGRFGWGYDVAAPYAPHAAYGAPGDLKALVDACHARGLAVVFDVVPNHLGPEGNHLARFGPYFSERHHTAWGPAPNFDGPDSGPVRRHFLDALLVWLREYRGDGLRLDAVHAIRDDSPVHFLAELAQEVAELAREQSRPLVLIAESEDDDARLVLPRAEGGRGLDAIWADRIHHALHAHATGERSGYYAPFGSLARVARAFRDGFVEGAVSGERRVAFLQNHDQVGNRAQGDRLSALVSPARLRLLAGLLLTGPFVPLLFQGEEWGARTPFPFFCDYADADLRGRVRDGRCREFAAFGWSAEDLPDPTAEATFASARLDWSERERAPGAEHLAWVRALLALRARTPALRAGTFPSVRCDARAGWLALERGAFTSAANLGARAAALRVRGRGRAVWLASGEVALAGQTLRLGPDAFALLGPATGGRRPDGL